MTTSFVQTYLFFNGCCEEALEFYKSALGAQPLMLMRYKESPDAPPPGRIPPGWEDKVMHTSFRIGATTIMASDGCCADPGFRGLSLSLSLPTEAEAARCFAALAQGGQITMPLGKTFWSPCFGMVTDRFSLGWMVTVAPATPAS